MLLNCVKNHLKIFLIKSCGILHKKYHLCFCKNTKNETFTHISNKKHLTCTVPLENEISTAIKCSILPTDYYACSRSNDRATRDLIKRHVAKSAICMNFKTVEEMGQIWAFYNLLYRNKKNSNCGWDWYYIS